MGAALTALLALSAPPSKLREDPSSFVAHFCPYCPQSALAAPVSALAAPIPALTAPDYGVSGDEPYASEQPAAMALGRGYSENVPDGVVEPVGAKWIDTLAMAPLFV